MREWGEYGTGSGSTILDFQMRVLVRPQNFGTVSQSACTRKHIQTFNYFGHLVRRIVWRDALVRRFSPGRNRNLSDECSSLCPKGQEIMEALYNRL